MAIAQIGLTPPPANVVLIFSRQKRHLSAYYGIKFLLKMTVKMMNMMMKMVIILMFDEDNAQKSSTTMTLWSKYTSFKYYYLVKKKGPKQPGI